MPDEFRHVIAVLWRRLELSRPSFQQDDGATLVTDGIAIKLAPTADGGHIVLSAKAGELSDNPIVRDQQVTRLLKSNVDTLLSSRACACLDNLNAPRPSVMVRAVVHCDRVFVDRLAETISDIAYLAGEHGRELGGEPGRALGHDLGYAGGGSAAASRSLPNEDASDNMLVFRL